MLLHKIKNACVKLLRTLAMPAAIFLVVTVLARTVFLFALVPTGSMHPTLDEPCYVVSNRLAFRKAGPQRGDIVLFTRATEDKTIYAKRIVGLPGETLEIVDGVTYIDGTPLEESYLAEPAESLDFGPFTIPEDSYFLMGDNRNHSYDSRYWEEHFVPESNVLSEILFALHIPGGDF